MTEYEIHFQHSNSAHLSPGKIGCFSVEAAHEQITQLKDLGHEILKVETHECENAANE